MIKLSDRNIDSSLLKISLSKVGLLHRAVVLWKQSQPYTYVHGRLDHRNNVSAYPDLTEARDFDKRFIVLGCPDLWRLLLCVWFIFGSVALGEARHLFGCRR